MSDSQPTTSPASDSDIIRRGYDDRANTSRANLQRQRQHINHEIYKELRIRSGAEKMLKATTSTTGAKVASGSIATSRRDSGVKLQEMIALELGVVNARLQLLSEQLAEVNSQVSKYQNVEQSIPMVPVGLKETVDVNEDFTRIIRHIIEKHFYIIDDGDELTSNAGSVGASGRIKNSPQVEPTINEFLALREACRKPMRDENGVRMLYEYFNQLCLVERRFFAGNVEEMVEFQWYDSLTGIPFSQKSLAFEKGATLFNIAALHTQIGAAQDRTVRDGLDVAAEHFCRSAGLFEYIAKSFKYAPSMDMRNATLEGFKELMIAQAHECLYAKMLLNCTDVVDDNVDGTAMMPVDALHEISSQFAGSLSARSTAYSTGINNHNGNDAEIDSIDGSVLSSSLRGQTNMPLRYLSNNESNTPPLASIANGENFKHENVFSAADRIDAETAVSRLVLVAQQASRVSKAYASVRDSVNTTIVKEYFPSSWISLILVKMQHYRSLSHYYFGQAVMLCVETDDDLTDDVGDADEYGASNKENPAVMKKIPLLHKYAADSFDDVLLGALESHISGSVDTMLRFARGHFRQATLLQEEAIRTHEMCKHLRQVDLLFDFLRRSHEQALTALCDTEREDDLSDPIPVSDIVAALPPSLTGAAVSSVPAHLRTASSDSTNNSTATTSSANTAASSSAAAPPAAATLQVVPVDVIYPGFTHYKVRDMFANTLGPLAFFNCLNNWSPPKEVRLTRDSSSGFGFSIRGSAPVSISDVEKGSVAQAANLQVGDLIIEVNGQDARSALHEEVVGLIRASGQRLTLKTITMTRTSQATTATLNRRVARQEKKDRSSQAAAASASAAAARNRQKSSDEATNVQVQNNRPRNK